MGYNPEAGSLQLGSGEGNATRYPKGPLVTATPCSAIFSLAMFSSPETATLDADASEFARVQIQTTKPAASFQTPRLTKEGGGERSIVLASPAKCEMLTGMLCPVGELTVFQSTGQVVVSCGCSEVPEDFFTNLCTAVAAEKVEIPLFYDTDPRWPAVWAVAQQISHVHHKMATPCTIEWETPNSTGFAAFF